MVLRVEKIRNFTTMSNYHLRDKTLSLKAKGMLSMCLSLPDSWNYSIEGLVAISREGQTAVMNTIRELEAAGYVRRERARLDNGKLGKVEYIICEFPQRESPVDSAEEGTPGEEPPEAPPAEAPAVEKPPVENPSAEKPSAEKPSAENPSAENPSAEKPSAENPHVENPHVDNPGQLNTDQLNTEEINTEELNTEERNAGRRGAPARHRCGTYGNVLLSDAEMHALQAEFPGDYQQRIDRLSEYIASTGRQYQNHLATIRSWARRDADRAEPAKSGGVTIRGYGCGAPGQSELDAVRRLQRKHQRAAPS